MKFVEKCSEISLEMAEKELRFALSGGNIIEKKSSPTKLLTPNDSNDPSYTNLEVPYRVICRQRYHKAGTKHRLQFLKEIRMQEISQSKALGGVRIHRVFVNPVLAPPHPSEIIKLTPKQQFKLEQLLNS